MNFKCEDANGPAVVIGDRDHSGGGGRGFGDVHHRENNSSAGAAAVGDSEHGDQVTGGVEEV